MGQFGKARVTVTPMDIVVLSKFPTKSLNLAKTTDFRLIGRRINMRSKAIFFQSSEDVIVRWSIIWSFSDSFM